MKFTSGFGWTFESEEEKQAHEADMAARLAACRHNEPVDIDAEYHEVFGTYGMDA